MVTGRRRELTGGPFAILLAEDHTTRLLTVVAQLQLHGHHTTLGLGKHVLRAIDIEDLDEASLLGRLVGEIDVATGTGALGAVVDAVGMTIARMEKWLGRIALGLVLLNPIGGAHAHLHLTRTDVTARVGNLINAARSGGGGVGVHVHSHINVGRFERRGNNREHRQVFHFVLPWMDIVKNAGECRASRECGWLNF